MPTIKKPKYKIGDNVLVIREYMKDGKTPIYCLSKINNAFCNNYKDWNYSCISGNGKDMFMWYEEKDIIKV